jgi:ABC-type oligopeptide transport system substrate-binding subunit
LESYEADDLDVLDPWGLPLEETERARQRHAGECIPVPTLGLFYMGFDVSRPPFDDVRVRRAFALANDKQTLADAVMGGYFSPATGGLVSPGMPGHSEGIALPYDPERARQLLAEAGYPNGRAFPVVDLLTVAARPFFSQTSEHLQRQWRENLEIEVTCETMELEAYTVKLDRDPSHMFLYAMVADYADPDDFLRECNARHYARWQNQAYDRLVKEARCITDQEGRMRLYRQADRILVQEAAIIPLTYLRRYLLVKPWVSRFPMSAINTWFWKDAIIEPH